MPPVALGRPQQPARPAPGSFEASSRGSFEPAGDVFSFRARAAVGRHLSDGAASTASRLSEHPSDGGVSPWSERFTDGAASPVFPLGEHFWGPFGFSLDTPEERLPQDASRQEMLQASVALPERVAPPRIELEDLEVTTVPYTVYFKILVILADEKGSSHRVMKSYRDLQDLHKALSLELSSASAWLPGLPAPLPGQELTDASYQLRLGDYLACLALNKEAVRTYSFQNFFQFTHEYRQGNGMSLPRTRLDLAQRRFPELETVFEPAPAPSRSAPALMPPMYTGAAASQGSDSPASSSFQPPLPVRAHTAPLIHEPPLPPPLTTVSPSLLNLPPTARPDGSDSKPPSDGISQSYSSDEFGELQVPAPRKKHPRRRPWCVVCLANPQEMAIGPCGHLSMCQVCTAAVKECPVCRGPIQQVLRIYSA